MTWLMTSSTDEIILVFLSLIFRNFGFAEGTHVRENANKFVFSLTYFS